MLSSIENINRRIASVVDNSTFWQILVNDSMFRAGPFDGGCLTCAKAIMSVFGGEIVHVFNTAKQCTEHYGVQLRGGEIVDFNGVSDSPDVWLNSFSDMENLPIDLLHVRRGLDDKSEIIDDALTSLKIAELLKLDEP